VLWIYLYFEAAAKAIRGTALRVAAFGPASLSHAPSVWCEGCLEEGPNGPTRDPRQFVVCGCSKSEDNLKSKMKADVVELLCDFFISY
jgi:hypothetical protein